MGRRDGAAAVEGAAGRQVASAVPGVAVERDRSQAVRPWSAAVDAAALPRHGQTKCTRERVLEALGNWAQENGRSPTSKELCAADHSRWPEPQPAARLFGAARRGTPPGLSRTSPGPSVASSDLLHRVAVSGAAGSHGSEQRGRRRRECSSQRSSSVAAGAPDAPPREGNRRVGAARGHRSLGSKAERHATCPVAHVDCAPRSRDYLPAGCGAYDRAGGSSRSRRALRRGRGRR